MSAFFHQLSLGNEFNGHAGATDAWYALYLGVAALVLWYRILAPVRLNLRHRMRVEAVIEEFDDVAQCVVVGIEDPERGEQVCAVVVAAQPTIDISSLAARARNQLSAYKVPTRWAIATSDQIPTLPSGKLNRKALRAKLIDGSLD